MTTVKELNQILNQKFTAFGTGLDDIKEAMLGLTREVAEVKSNQREQHADFIQLAKRVKVAEEVLQNNQKQIVSLEERVDQLEQYTRKDNIIISGLPAHSYAATARKSVSTEPDDVTDEELEANVLKFFETDLGVPLSPADISVIHYVPSKQGKNILVKFTSRKAKLRVLKNRANLKGKKIYVSDHLTRRNNQLFYQARMLVKDNLISRAWVRNCKVFIRSNGEPNVAKTYSITCGNELQKFRV